MSNQLNHKQSEDIAHITTDISWIKNELNEIRNNHLKHIYSSLDNHKNWLIGILVTLIFTLLGTILNLIK